MLCDRWEKKETGDMYFTPWRKQIIDKFAILGSPSEIGSTVTTVRLKRVPVSILETRFTFTPSGAICDLVH